MSAPFALVGDGLVYLPTPSSANVKGYRDFFRRVHADAEFCQVAFGDDFKPRSWTDEETKDFLLDGDVKHSWDVRAMGDFAIGLLPEADKDGNPLSDATYEGRQLKGTKKEVRIVEGAAFEALSEEFDRITWVGYNCARDATSQCHFGDQPTPPWQELLEARYGLDPAFRGRGIATRSGEVVMQWAVEERGAKRFIAETKTWNTQSAKVLERLGFTLSGTDYFRLQDVVEWEKVVA